jgi:hypothetical protein
MANRAKSLGIAGAVVAAAVVTSTALFLSSSDVTRVPVGESLQAALDAAVCGAVLEVEAGAAYGNIVLSKNCGANPIVIRSSRADELPENVRVTPAQAPLLAKLQSTVVAEPAIKTAPGAQGYRFIGVDISTATPTAVIYDLVRFGDGRQTQTTIASVPRGLSIDRSWIHGWSTQDVQRGVAMNCADCEIVNSYVSDIHGVGFDTQAVCAWNTPGPLRIINNYLEGAGENVLIGGADPASAEMVPSDIQIRRNHVPKPLTWKVDDPTYAGHHWTVKNSLELKNAKNVTIDANIFENNWTDGQTGIPILFTVRNQEGSAPYSIITNVVFTNNIVLNAQGGINLLGSDNEKPSQRSSALLVANNVFDRITGPWLTMNGYHDVTIENNTHLQTCNSGCNTMLLYGEQSLRFIYRRNVTRERAYGVFGDGGLIGKPAFDKWTPDAVVTDNVVENPYEPWPGGNEAVTALAIGSDYRTPYTGKGADIDKLLAAQAGAVPVPTVATPTPTGTPVSSPVPSPTPTPSPVPTATPSPSPRPSPTATVLPVCRSGQFVGQPPTCRCLTGMRGNSGKCR